MTYLIDTHILLWFMNGDSQLSGTMRDIITNKDNVCFVSIASIWEIAVKCNIGKLQLNKGFNEIGGFLRLNDINILSVELAHLDTHLHLELLHRDPFDRLIISQAISESMTILTVDEQFKKYPVSIV